MTPRQKAFCEHFAACGNGTEAAKRAGYSERTAGSIGWELLKKPEIQIFLAEIQKQAEAGRVASATETKEFLTSVLRSSDERTRDRINAGKLLLRTAGSGGSSAPDPLPEISEEEAEEENRTIICVPYNGSLEANAVILPDGEVFPLAGFEKSDVLIYREFAHWSISDFEFHDEIEVESNGK